MPLKLVPLLSADRTKEYGITLFDTLDRLFWKRHTGLIDRSATQQHFCIFEIASLCDRDSIQDFDRFIDDLRTDPVTLDNSYFVTFRHTASPCFFWLAISFLANWINPPASTSSCINSGIGVNA